MNRTIKCCYCHEGGCHSGQRPGYTAGRNINQWKNRSDRLAEEQRKELKGFRGLRKKS